MPSVSSVSPCDCCCPGGKKCFQEWIAAWSCVDESWTGPVTDNRVCLDVGTATGWEKVTGTASGCQYRIRVPYEPMACCTENGDCASELGDTATPDLPYGGSGPPDCCGCTIDCLLAPDPGCCPAPGQPNQVEVTIVAASCSPLCTFDTASPYEVHVLDVGGLAGRTFTLPYHVPGPLDPLGLCSYYLSVDVTAWVKMKSCNGDGTGCAACTPSTDITASTIMTITIHPVTSAPVFSFLITTTSTTLDNGPQFLPVNGVSIDGGAPATCCEPYSCSGAGRVGDPNDPYSVYITSVMVVPC